MPRENDFYKTVKYQLLNITNLHKIGQKHACFLITYIHTPEALVTVKSLWDLTAHNAKNLKYTLLSIKNAH